MSSQITLVGSQRGAGAITRPRRIRIESSDEEEVGEMPLPPPSRLPRQQPKKRKRINVIPRPNESNSDEELQVPSLKKGRVEKGKQRATEVVPETPEPEPEPEQMHFSGGDAVQLLPAEFHQPAEEEEDQEAVDLLLGKNEGKNEEESQDPFAVDSDVEAPHRKARERVVATKAAETSPDDERTEQQLFGTSNPRPTSGSRASSVAIPSAMHLLHIDNRSMTTPSTPHRHETYHSVYMPSVVSSPQSPDIIPVSGTRASTEKQRRAQKKSDSEYVPLDGTRAAEYVSATQRRTTLA